MDDNIPLLDLKSQYQAIKREIQDAINRVLDSQRFILGPEVEQLEYEFSELCQCNYAIGVSSGSDALLVSLMALDIGSGDEVITTSYSFFATAGAISRLGARPVFTDIKLDSFNMAADQVEDLITPHTKAIIPVHLFGQMADLDAIKAVAIRYGIPIIEDAAQAVGAKSGTVCAGTAGDIGCFSFFPTKNLGGIGDGGIVTTNQSDIADRIRILRSHGAKSKYLHTEVGGNFRLDEIQAAVIRVKMHHLDRWTEFRRSNALRYIELFKNKHSIEDKKLDLALPLELSDRKHVYNQFTIRTGDRDNLRNYLRECGIGCEVYYPTPLPMQPCFRHLTSDRSYPNSEVASNTSLSIPIYPELTLKQQTRIAKSICDFLSANQTL